MTVIVPPPGRPGQGRPHDHMREGSYTWPWRAQAEEDPMPNPPDRRLPRRNRPDHRALVITWTYEFNLVSCWPPRHQAAASSADARPRCVTIDTYDHVLPALREEAADAIDELFGA
jgi:hypothetical protein